MTSACCPYAGACGARLKASDLSGVYGLDCGLPLSRPARMPKFSDYVVFVDESGDHSLVSVDPSYPVFVLAFAIFEKRARAATRRPGRAPGGEEVDRSGAAEPRLRHP